MVIVVVVVVEVRFVSVCWVWVLLEETVCSTGLEVDNFSYFANSFEARSLIEKFVCVVDLGEAIGVVVGLDIGSACLRICLKVEVRFFLVLLRFLVTDDDVVAIEELLEVAKVVAIV